MEFQEYTECNNCASFDALVFFEPKYNGMRGSCPHCGGNWPES